MKSSITEPSPHRVILDCDPGNGVPATDIDDGLALGLLLAHPDMTVEAVTIVSGNTHRDVGFHVARTMLRTVGQEVPVYAGAARALLEPDSPWAERRDEKRDSSLALKLWTGVPAPERFSLDSAYSAAAEIAHRVKEEPGQITVVAIGPLTNIAHAMQLHPGFADDVRHLVIMGGAFDVPGYLQELNFGIDPEAAKLVLASGADITLVPLDLTMRTTLTHEDLDRLSTSETPLARYLRETTAPWISYCEAERGTTGCRLHDPLAAALLIDPTLVKTCRSSVDVQLDGIARSRPIRWQRDEVRLAAGIDLPQTPEIDIAYEVDNARLVDLLTEQISTGPRT